MKSMTVQTIGKGSGMTRSNSLSKSPKRSREKRRISPTNFKDTMPIDDL